MRCWNVGNKTKNRPKDEWNTNPMNGFVCPILMTFSIFTKKFFYFSHLVDFNLNISIAKLLLDVDSSGTVSFVPLTGLVCESVFVFGKYLFFIHAIILAYILNIFANFLTSRDSFKTLLIYAIVFTCLGVSRAGTSGSVSYPFILKTLFYVPLILFIFNLTKYVKYK